MTRFMWAAALMLGLGQTAQAQHSLILQRLEQWNAAAPQPPREKLIAAVKQAAIKVYADEPRCAQTDPIIVALGPATAERYIFQSRIRNALQNGWHVVVSHPKCDSEQVRYLVIQSNDQNLSAFRVNRGASHAHDSLIADSLPLVFISAEATLKRANISCDPAGTKKLGAFRIDEEEPGLGPSRFGVRYAGSWSEIWPVEYCGRTIEIAIHFTADGDGGAAWNIKGNRAKIISGARN